jgi:predicted amidohydrolase
MSTQAAALQLPFAYVSTPQEFTDLVRGPIERAARAGAHLIVLPDYFSYALFGMFVLDARADAPLPELAQMLGFASAPALMRDRAPYVYDFHVHIFQSLAERTATWLAPGTVPEVNDGHWYNTALLFSPDGKIFGRQRQTHRTPEERTQGLSVGEELRVFNTDVGRIGFVIGADVRYPEVSRILALQGANVLIHPAAMRESNSEQFLSDLWREVQSNQVFGVQANLVGEAYRGRSAIYAPVELTPDHRGILAPARSDSAAESIAAELDFDALQKVIDEYPIFDFFNYEPYKRLGPSRNE